MVGFWTKTDVTDPMDRMTRLYFHAPRDTIIEPSEHRQEPDRNDQWKLCPVIGTRNLKEFIMCGHYYDGDEDGYGDGDWDEDVRLDLGNNKAWGRDTGHLIIQILRTYMYIYI